MKNIEKILEEFIKLLEDENRLLIESINKKSASDKLLEVVEKKEKTLSTILSFDKKDVAPYRELLKKIDELTQRNKILANSNIEFINELFESIFEDSTKQYTKDGNLASNSKTILNKKV